jgi:hypothetical protein
MGKASIDEASAGKDWVADESGGMASGIKRGVPNQVGYYGSGVFSAYSWCL